MTTPDPYRPDPYLPAGPDGPLLVPNPAAVMFWPNVAAHLEKLHGTGALTKVEACRPALSGWWALVLHARQADGIRQQDPCRLRMFTPTGPAGLLLVPNPVAVMFWPAVPAWVDEHERMGARDKLLATEPVRNRWEELAIHAEGFERETAGRVEGSPPRRLHHEDDWISTDAAADELGCTPQWVRALARRGDLDSRTVGRTRLIRRRSVREHRQRTHAA